MIKVLLDYAKLNNLATYISDKEIKQIGEMIYKKTGLGSDFLGWLDWAENYLNDKEYTELKLKAEQIKKQVEVCLVIGIGGSYLGARAADNMINGLHNKNNVEMIYIGNTMSATYLAQIKDYVKDKKFSIINISKSGTTVEPSISFRIFEELLINQIGQENAKELIIAITDKSKGALFTLAKSKGYKSFVIPDNIGGRFSVLTPVGLLPLAISGVNTDQVLLGAIKAQKKLADISLNNEAIKYAVARYLLHTKYNFKVEALVSYEMQMQLMCEWWKQLFGESEGKENKGLLPFSMIFSTDLHSLGQFVQEGTKNILFETIIDIKKPTLDLLIPKTVDNLDNLNYLTDKTINEINHVALKGVLQAHADSANIPNIILEFESMNDLQFGYAVYFFELAVAYSGYLLGINPFNQPGVEIYKKNMFKLLGKPQ
ncbi:glucose-6-phosphate isomerase [Spiroplasma endosymbiont of Labia minor]|uniref:glucose-6-phosphate isomerase n=1 Tax=Spiroplasma endosymbiont of Labia minor TaxID=3066305 RepID=UPI0030D0EAC5